MISFYYRKSGRALQLAKKHIEEEYSVVGITEDLKNTMVLLENYIPGIEYYFVLLKL